MIKALITDGDGVLNLPGAHPKTTELLDFLDENGIKNVVLSNDSDSVIRAKFRKAGYNEPDLIVTPNSFTPSKKKPSPDFVYAVRDHFSINLNEIVYVGDSQVTDIYCAINAGVLALGADYSRSRSGKTLEYCINIGSIDGVIKFLKMFGRMASPYFGWELIRNGIDVRCAIAQHGRISGSLTSLLKNQKDFTFSSGLSASDLVYYTLLTQLYFSGLANHADIITIYPGHSPGSINPIFSKFLKDYQKMLSIDYKDLIIRHTPASSSRISGNRHLENQINTIMLDQSRKGDILGKHIIVLDDFTTSGTSLEAARILLERAGASKVTLIALGKFRGSHNVYTLNSTINPYTSNQITRRDYTFNPFSSTNNSDNYFNTYILPIFQK